MRIDWEIQTNFDSTDFAVCLSSRYLILIMSLKQRTMNKRRRWRKYRVILVRGSLLQCAESIFFSVIFKYSKWFCLFFLFLFFLFVLYHLAFDIRTHKRNRTMTTMNLFWVVWIFDLVWYCHHNFYGYGQRATKNIYLNRNKQNSRPHLVWTVFK